MKAGCYHYYSFVVIKSYWEAEQYRVLFPKTHVIWLRVGWSLLGWFGVLEVQWKSSVALTGVAQWVGCCPTKLKVAGLIPSQGTCLGCGPGPLLEVCTRQLVDVSLAHQCFAPSVSPSFPLTLKINKILKQQQQQKSSVVVLSVPTWSPSRSECCLLAAPFSRLLPLAKAAVLLRWVFLSAPCSQWWTDTGYKRPGPLPQSNTNCMWYNSCSRAPLGAEPLNLLCSALLTPLLVKLPQE